MPTQTNLNNMTVDQLTRELKGRNVPIPKSSIRKEVLIDLYKKHVLNDSPRNTPDVYSSDDDDVLRNNPDENNSYVNASYLGEDILNLTDSELRAKLRSFDEGVGPITNSTRSVYRKKLAKYMSGEISSPNLNTLAPDNAATYSDDEDEGIVPTCDVSIQNDQSLEEGAGDNDEVDSRINKHVSEVTETKYTKTIQQRSSVWPAGSAWARKFDEAENVIHSGSRKSSASAFDNGDERRDNGNGVSDGIFQSKESMGSPSRDFHRRSLAIHGLTQRPPIPSYSPNRLMSSRLSSETDGAEVHQRQIYNSTHSTRSQRHAPVESKKSRRSCGSMLVVVVIFSILALFGYAVYLNIEPNDLPRLP